MPLSALILALAGQSISWGHAKVDITPPEPLPLGGYTARGDHLFSPGGEQLYAQAQILIQGKTKVAIVSFDGLTVPESLAKRVQAQFPQIKVILVATHTHSAPDTQMFNEKMTFRVPGIAPYSRKWTDWMVEKLASAVRASVKSESKIQADFAIRFAPSDVNRGRREGAIPDKTFTLVSIAGEDQQTPLFLHYAAHGTIYDETHMQTSGDWPAGLRNAYPPALFLPGAIGDVSPKSDKGTDQERINTMIQTLKIDLARRGETSIEAPDLAYVEAPIDLPPPEPHPDFAEANKVNDILAKLFVSRVAPTEGKVRLLQLSRKTVLVFIPGEPTAAVGRQIQAAGWLAGYKRVLVISHANGWIGYILTSDDYAKGGYEATLSFHGPGTAKKVVEAAIEAFDQINRAKA